MNKVRATSVSSECVATDFDGVDLVCLIYSAKVMYVHTTSFINNMHHTETDTVYILRSIYLDVCI